MGIDLAAVLRVDGGAADRRRHQVVLLVQGLQHLLHERGARRPGLGAVRRGRQLITARPQLLPERLLRTGERVQGSVVQAAAFACLP